MAKLDYPIQMEIAGPTALFSRPDCGDSPASYPAPTYSAVKAMFESVLWLPAVEVIPQKVEICSPLQWHSYATNYGGPLRNPQKVKDGTQYQLFVTVLIDVCYRLYAIARPNQKKANLPDKALQWDLRTTSPGHAYQEIFNRRLKRGQSYAGLCLGWREFTPSYFGPFREETSVFSDMPDIVIPSMLRQVFPDGYKSSYHAVYDKDLLVQHGTLIFPEGGLKNDQ